MGFRLIHCSDIHLGACMHQDDRYKDFFIAFSRIIDCALEQSVDAFVIAGDFFHQRSIDARTLSKAMELLIQLKNANIPVIAIEGNHDKAFYMDRQSWLEFLNEKELLSLLEPRRDENGYHVDPQKSIWENEAIRIVGFGYLGSMAEKRIEQMAEELEQVKKPTIVLLHAGINRLMAQDMSGIPEKALQPLENKVDYIALGHIHGRYQIQDWAYNPGAPECVHIDEGKKAEKGCYLIEFDGLDKQVQFIPIEHRSIQFLDIQLQSENKEDLITQIVDILPEDVSKTILQIALQGCMHIDSLNLREIEKEIQETVQCFSIEIVDETTWQMKQVDHNLDREAMEASVLSILAEEMNLVIGSSTTTTLQVLKKGLLEGEATNDLLQYIAEQSEVICVD